MPASNSKGPRPLRDWVFRWADFFRSACRLGLAEGHPADDIVVWTMPHTESPDGPPPGFNVFCRDRARLRCNGHLSPLRDTLGNPSPPGTFYAVASCAAGRLEGTLVALLEIPRPAEELPAVEWTDPSSRRLPEPTEERAGGTGTAELPQ
jgi:hypothetical protein